MRPDFTFAIKLILTDTHYNRNTKQKQTPFLSQDSIYLSTNSPKLVKRVYKCLFELAVFSNQPDYTSLGEEVNFLLITYMSIRILSATAKFNHFDFVVSFVVTISRKSLKCKMFYQPSRSKYGKFATLISCIEIHKISLIFLGQ